MKKHEKGTTISGFDITDVEGLDRITVYYENYYEGQGRITIICSDEAWSCYLGAMGTNILDFFVSCDEHYIAKKLSNIKSSVIDYDLISDKICKDVNQETALLYSELLSEEYGQDWRMNLPTTSNYKYEYLCRIIKTVQEAILL